MINYLIQPQNFELVRDALGFVLASELENQRSFPNSRFTEPAEIFRERTTAISNSEDVVINITLTSDEFSNKTQKDSQGKTFFNIEIFSHGAASDETTGSLDSAMKLHKYIGFVRHVLSHTEYKTLTLEPGYIGGTAVESFEVMESNNREDADFSKMAIVVFSVRIQENQGMAEATEINEIYSRMNIEETDLGYIFQTIK